MAKVKDPVCGMLIESTTAEGGCYEYEGVSYYFCSTDERERFERNPRNFLEKAAGLEAHRAGDTGKLEQHEPRYTKKGGMVAPKFGSAGSGGAEYERLPERHDRDDQA